MSGGTGGSDLATAGGAGGSIDPVTGAATAGASGQLDSGSGSSGGGGGSAGGGAGGTSPAGSAATGGTGGTGGSDGGVLSVTSATNASALTGTAGTAGAAATGTSPGLGGAGGGGEGGYGLILTAATDSTTAFSNAAALTGGAGGSGGPRTTTNGSAPYGQAAAGDGGVALDILPGGITLTNSAALQGGDAGGYNAPGTNTANVGGGSGGAGLRGAGLTLIDSGTISAGHNGDGTIGDALDLTGGANTLALSAGNLLTGDIAVGTGGTLTFNQAAGGYTNGLTLANAITGAGGIVKGDATTLTLSGANTYTGATTISAGTLALTGVGTIATSSGITDNGVFDISGTSGSTVSTLSGTNASATVLLGAQTLTVSDGSTNFAGAINGTGGLSVTGGTQTLSGTNGYSGATTIAAGATLQLGGGSGSGSISNTSGITDNGTLHFSNYGLTSPLATVISGSGSLVQDGPFSTLVLTADETYTGVTTIGAMSGLQLGDGATTGSIADTSAIDDSGTLVFNHSDALTFGQAITGSGGLSQLGPGTLTLNTAQTYTGNTNIEAGSTLQLGDGGTTGSIASTSGITDDGTLAVDESGALTFGMVISGAGALTVAGGGTTVLGAANTFTGGTTIGAASTLEIGAQGSAGTGAITFGGGLAVLRLEAVPANNATFADTLDGMSNGDALDLAGLVFSSGATATLSNGTLTVSSGGTSESFMLSNDSVSQFAVSADAQGGTLVTAYAPPTIAGTAAGQSTTAEAPLTPFSRVTVTDPNGGSDTLTITLQGSGTLAGAGTADAAGAYTLTGSAAALTRQLAAVTFTPAAGQPGTSTTTGFTLVDVSSVTPAATVTDMVTTVTDTAAPAPTQVMTPTPAATIAPTPTPTAPAASPLPPTPAASPTVSLDRSVTYAGGVFTLMGTAASAAGVRAVEVSAVVDGVAMDLGAATVNGDGTFTVQDRIGSATQSFFTATLTDGAGRQTVSADPGFALTGGLGRNGAGARQTLTTADGSGVTTSALFQPGGSRKVDVTASGQTLTSGHFDQFDNHGTPNTTFVFDPGHGLDVVSGFRVGGPDHDTLSFLGADFGNDVADVLRHTKGTAGGVLIVDPTSGDAVKLAGVTKSQLAHNKGDFTFHA